MQAVLADQANSIDKTKKIPVLVVEDMDFANALVEAQIEPV